MPWRLPATLTEEERASALQELVGTIPDEFKDWFDSKYPTIAGMLVEVEALPAADVEAE